MAVPSWPPKDPDEVLDYELDWSARLGADVIATSEFSIAAGDVVKDDDDKTDTTTKIWLSGGTVGGDNLVRNRITTTGGRTMDQTVRLKVQQR